MIRLDFDRWWNIELRSCLTTGCVPALVLGLGYIE